MKRLLFAMMLSLPLVITSCQKNDGISSTNEENSSLNNMKERTLYYHELNNNWWMKT